MTQVEETTSDTTARSCRSGWRSWAASIVVQKVKDAKGAEGYNAGSDKYENLVGAGVIDPVKVVRTALQNASSIASLLLTTEALVSELPKDEKEPAAPGGPGGMGGMY